MRGEQWSDCLSGDELRRKRAEIDQAMKGVIADGLYRRNPNAFEGSLTVTPVGAVVAVEGNAPVSRGWQTPTPLEPVLRPGGTAEMALSAMVDQAFPPSKSELRARLLTELRALSPEHRAALLARCEERGDAGAELKALALEAWR
jgi:hypothetical protein